MNNHKLRLALITSIKEELQTLEKFYIPRSLSIYIIDHLFYMLESLEIAELQTMSLIKKDDVTDESTDKIISE